MQTVLITGGSSGIGLEMSRHFGKAGYRLIWVSKPEEELAKAKAQLIEELPTVEIHTMAKDLSNQAAAKEVYDWTKQKDWEVNVLINNAGFGTYGYQKDTSIEEELAMIQLNVINLYQLTRFFLQDMLQKDAGTIINISSNSSFQPVPRMNTYASTKAFVKHFSRGLQEELKMLRSNVRVMTVCPAAIKDTPFKTSAKMEKVKTFTGLAYTTAKEVAKDVFKGFQQGKTFVISGWKMRLLYSIHNFVPYGLQQFLVRKETEIKN